MRAHASYNVDVAGTKESIVHNSKIWHGKIKRVWNQTSDATCRSSKLRIFVLQLAVGSLGKTQCNIHPDVIAYNL
jgi:hypothetical protein